MKKEKKNTLLIIWIALLLTQFVLSNAYPSVRIDQRVYGWRASGRTTYVACSGGKFELEFSEPFDEYRGACLLTDITAVMYRGNQSVRARPYECSGTSYSQFEIVADGPASFCIRRVGTEC